MKRYRYYTLLILLMLVSLWGCECGGNLRIHNSTSHPLYAGVEAGMDVMIPAGQEHVFKVGTERQTILTGEIEKTVLLHMLGETYSIYDQWDGYIDTTYVTIKAGKTLSAYILPNRAGIKVINNSSDNILQADIYKCTNISNTRVAVLTGIDSGTSQFKRVDYTDPNTPFYYQVVLRMEDGNDYAYGDQTTVLHVDDVFTVTLNDPETTVKRGYSK